MVYIKYFIFTIMMSFFTTGCSIKTEAISDDIQIKNYILAQQELKKGNYKRAIKDLESLNNRYPFGYYIQQVQLDLIFAYYKVGDKLLAKIAIDRFLSAYPTHLNKDYVLYMRGLTNMSLDENVTKKLPWVNRYDCNPEYARAAFYDFSQLLRNYPNSRYSKDAEKRLIYLKDRLAKYELSVLKYYSKHRAYVAVIKRVEKMLHDFSDTQATRHSLPYMEEAYRKLKLKKQAEIVSKLIALNSVQ